MQKISFTSSLGTIEIGDVNCSSLNGEKIFRLNDFDGNSAKTKIHAVQCIGMAGQRVLSVLPDVKTVTAKIGFAPVYLSDNRLVCTGSAGMYTLRREVMRHFPLGQIGTLVYTNDNGSWETRARIDEIPFITVKNGWLCECNLMFTLDYPYWCRTVTTEAQTVSGSGGSAVFETINLGDTESPIAGTIYCTSDIGESTDIEYGDYFRITEGGDTNRAIHFVKPLSVNDELYFSLEYGNEFIVKKRKRYPGGSTTAWGNAFDYISFPTNYEPCHIGAPGYISGVPLGTMFTFSLFASGSLSVKLDYRYLYTAI